MRWHYVVTVESQARLIGLNALGGEQFVGLGDLLRAWFRAMVEGVRDAQLLVFLPSELMKGENFDPLDGVQGFDGLGDGGDIRLSIGEIGDKDEADPHWFAER